MFPILLEVLQRRELRWQCWGGSALAELLEGVCSVGTRLGNDPECVPLGRVGGGHCCPSQPAWAAGGGQGRTSPLGCDQPQGTSPEPPILPWGWLSSCACLSLLLLPDPGLSPPPLSAFLPASDGVWPLGSSQLLPHWGLRDEELLPPAPGKILASSRNTHAEHTSVSLSRDHAEGDAQRTSL